MSDPADPPDIPCPACGSPLALHQPEPGTPDRLLGTCPSCRAWYLLDGDARPVAVLVPPTARHASGPPPGPVGPGG